MSERPPGGGAQASIHVPVQLVPSHIAVAASKKRLVMMLSRCFKRRGISRMIALPQIVLHDDKRDTWEAGELIVASQ